MTRSSFFLPALVLSVFSFAGCAEKKVSPPHAHHAEFEVTLCGLCGDIKDEGHKCKEGAKICTNCGLHKGSVLCCSSAFTGSPRDVILCSKCGEKAFSSKCCQKSIAACPKCGLHKGSPGCCKIDRKVDDGTGHAKKVGHEGEAG